MKRETGLRPPEVKDPKHIATHCIQTVSNVSSIVCLHGKFLTSHTLQHTATQRNTMQDTVIHFNTLQHTTTHCNTSLIVTLHSTFSCEKAFETFYPHLSKCIDPTLDEMMKTIVNFLKSLLWQSLHQRGKQTYCRLAKDSRRIAEIDRKNPKSACYYFF